MKQRKTIRSSLLSLCLLLGPGLLPASADEDDLDPYEFSDLPLATEDLVKYPPWFKDSFLDLESDLAEAIASGKTGIVVYFGQQRCAYCKQLMDVNFGLDDIVDYTQKNFDVIPVDIWSTEEVTIPSGVTMTERDYAVQMNTNFTPSLIFYNAQGKIALRLRGYYPPYQFRAALEYVADAHYKREKFSVYLARGDDTQHFEADDLVEEDFFSAPPYNLDRSRFKAQLPLAVFFEQGLCHSCDILHTQPLQRPSIYSLFEQFESIQLDIHADTPVVRPNGQVTTARQWARDLDLRYAPSLLFFDERGREIARVDSVIRFFRLRNVLNYVISKGYLSYPTMQAWRVAQDKARIEEQDEKTLKSVN